MATDIAFILIALFAIVTAIKISKDDDAAN